MRPAHHTFFSSVFAIIILAACTSPAQQSPKAKRAIAAAPSVQIPTSGLSAQQLEPGECGLFLWTKGQPNTLIFFSKAGTKSAIMKIDDNEQVLTQITATGAIFGQFMTEQTYRTPTNMTISLTYVAGKEMEYGQRIDNGRLTLSTSEGWETIMPVVGVRACQPG